MFGTKSEKVSREIEQLELKLEELETNEPSASQHPQRQALREKEASAIAGASATRSAHAFACRRCMPGVWQRVAKLGEDVSEILESRPASR